MRRTSRRFITHIEMQRHEGHIICLHELQTKRVISICIMNVKGTLRSLHPSRCKNLLEGGRAVGHKGRADLGATVRERELELGSEELLDIRAVDILGFLDLNDSDDLRNRLYQPTLHIQGPYDTHVN